MNFLRATIRLNNKRYSKAETNEVNLKRQHKGSRKEMSPTLKIHQVQMQKQ